MTKGGELMAKTKRNVQDNYNTVFAKRLRELIESTGVSQAELANSVSVTRQAINSLIDIKSNDITVKSICEEIGLSDKSVNLLIYLNRIKKLEKEARTLLAKDTNRNLVRESDYFDCESSNKLFSYFGHNKLLYGKYNILLERYGDFKKNCYRKHIRR